MAEYEELDLHRLKEVGLNPSHQWQIYLAALEYIRAGFYVLPIVMNDKKLPRKDYNVNYGSASRSKINVDKWFHPEEGRFKGWNLGIGCGRDGGVFVIDVDMHGGIDGFANLKRLEDEHDRLPDCPSQRTPNGGKHYFFRWQENAACTTNKIAPGIDTRGGDALSCKGHVVVWPSIVNDKKYEWDTGGELPDVPSWAMERMGVLWRPVKYAKGNRGNENVGDDDYEQTIPVDQVGRMLSYIQIDELDYDGWLKVGMAIKSQYPDGSGLDIWDAWSSGGSRYKDGECRVRWNGFSDSGSVRAGTLFYYAKEGGWEVDPIVDQVKGNKFDEVVARMNDEYAIVSVGGKIKVLREKEPEHQTMMHYDLFDKDSFRTLLQNELMVIVNAKGQPKSISVADIWLSHEHRRTYPNGMGLYPSKAPNGYFNTWNGFSVYPRPGDCSLFCEHVKQIICAGNEALYTWVLDWMADLIQYPDDPKGCAIVMRGGEGIGKGTFANAIGDLFGPHYRHLIDDSHLTSNFNAHLIDAIVVFADEITWGGNKKTAGKLKGMVTERHLVGERKGVDASLYRNMIHMLIASNDRWLIPAGADSRRWLVLDVPSDRANDVSYFESIKDELDNGGKEGLIYMLKRREITSNLRQAPETEALQEQRIMSAQQDTLLNWWCMILTAGKMETPDENEFEPGRDTRPEWPEMVDKVTFYNEYEEWCLKRRIRAISMNIFFKDVKRQLGIHDTRATINKKRKRVFKILSIKKSSMFIDKKYKNILGGEDEDDIQD